MNREQILQRFETLRQWGSGGERAPHKPLLVLYAIGKLLRGEDRLISYTDDIEENLKNLLREFGPRRDRYNPHFPFWRLQNDGIWEVSDADRIRQTDSGDPYITDLRNYNVSGGFTEEIATQLRRNSGLASEIIGRLLAAHFPVTYHEDILHDVGIGLLFDIPKLPRASNSQSKQRRDPNFRKNILKAYKFRCAICGFNVTLGGRPIALEAAHVKWWTAKGPDEVGNGIALCSLHHKLFDRGAFTLSDQLVFRVSEEVDKTSVGFDEWLKQFDDQEVQFPPESTYYPHEDYIDWHVREVFKGDYREL